MHLVSTLDEVRRDLDDIGADLPTDSLVARNPTGDIVAFATVYVRPGTSRDRRATLWGEVHPEVRGAGIEDRILDWMVTRGEHRLAGLPDDLPRFLETTVYDFLADRRRRLEERGFAVARWWSDMGRDLARPLPAAPVPDGIEIAPWDPGRSDEVRRTHNAAFLDHYGTNPLSLDEWEKWFVGSETFRPDLSFLAVTAGAVVGYATSYVYPEDFPVRDRSEAWIGQLGVTREWRRRGVASTLVATCLSAHAEAGLEFGALMVDAANETGAVGLYRRLGFEVEQRWLSYRRAPGGTGPVL